jgi:predicted TIM-barrel fold metal-dependent hydrolase
VKNIISIFLIIYSSIVIAKDNKLPLDAHLHYWPEDDQFLGIKQEPCEDKYEIINGIRRSVSTCVREEDDEWLTNYQNFIKDDKVQTAFLISPSFTMKHRKSPIDIEGTNLSESWKFQKKYISIMDKQTSDITQKYPGRFIGFCGLNYTWEPTDAVKRVKNCLNLPGMKGIKMHSFSTTDELSLRVEKVQKVIEKTLSEVSKEKPIVLWHIKPVVDNHAEITVLFTMALKYPEIKFIIAHSMYGEKNIHYLLSLEDRNGKRLENLFLETSASDPNSLKDAWIDFGLDRVLYGSDNMNSNDLSYRQFLDSGLSQKERYSVTHNSSKSIFHGLNIFNAERERGKEIKNNIQGTTHITSKVIKE